MAPNLLHVITAQPSSIEEANDALRAMRHAVARQKADRTILLFCDLPACDTAVSPQDDTLIRHLQSGVAAAESRRPSVFILLIRRRTWNDAARMYLGRDQTESVEQVVCELIHCGKTNAAFHVATRTLSAFKGCCQAVLFSDASCFCTPDVPMRMLHALEQTGASCLGAHVIPAAEFPQSVLARLDQRGFSFSVSHEAAQSALRRNRLAEPEAPRIYEAEQFHVLPCNKTEIPLAENCFFVRQAVSSPRSLLSDLHRRILHGKSRLELLPLFQIILLFFSGCFGLPFIAGLSVLLPESSSLLHLSRLPGALVRLCLLPLIAFVSLDAWLCRLLCRSSYLRIRVPAFCFSPAVCSACGSLLLTAAFLSAKALHILLLIGLLWLFAPLVLSALSMPTIERIPMDQDGLSQLRSLACDAFCTAHVVSPPQNLLARQMLAACAGSMLGLLEADQAAREVHSLFLQLADENAPLCSAVDQAAMLSCAQYLRETMGQCDAALRPLPAQIDSYVLSLPAPTGKDPLSILLCAAHQESGTVPAKDAQDTPTLAALFLPLRSAKETPMNDATLALTHPHTYLSLYMSGAEIETKHPTDSFLSLCAAALSHPFYRLLRRSPVAAPYVPLLLI